MIWMLLLAVLTLAVVYQARTGSGIHRNGHKLRLVSFFIRDDWTFDRSPDMAPDVHQAHCPCWEMPSSSSSHGTFYSTGSCNAGRSSARRLWRSLSPVSRRAF